MKTPRIDKGIIGIISLGFFSIFFEIHSLDFAIFTLFIYVSLKSLFRARDKKRFIKRHLLEIFFAFAILLLFIYAKYTHFLVAPHSLHRFPTKLILIASLVVFFNAMLNLKELSIYLRNLGKRPARTILLSFILIILVGAILLRAPIATPDHSKVSFINALFTATSATCVTGLVVGNTATTFSPFGKSIIMCLMQIGGLGIMILAASVAFYIGKRLSVQDKAAMSYMLDDASMRNLTERIRNIIAFTFSFELCGAILLFAPFQKVTGSSLKAVFFSLFHSISAFCNAGFVLFSNNLEQFRSSPLVNFVIAGLIISGGISFVVIGNTFRNSKARVKRRFFRGKKKPEELTLNTKIVLIITVALILSGIFLIHASERNFAFQHIGMKTQFLESFFQSVTLRTAGFNTMDIGGLRTYTYFLMILFMFIGGASGSTAGGIKVNTLGVIWAHMKAIFNNKDEAVLMGHSISKKLVSEAFLVIFLSIGAISVSVMLLTISENKDFIKLVFEVVSAFGTVGLSTGITPKLSSVGKFIIIATMIIGRIGPLTLVAILSRKGKPYTAQYPEGKVNIG